MHEDGVEPIHQILIVVGGDEAALAHARADRTLAVPCNPSLVIAADSGLDVAAAAGLRVDHVVGDLDSVDASLLHDVERAGVPVHRHEPDKDATDLELALRLAVTLAPAAGPTGAPGPATSLHVVGPGGGRLDLLAADLFLLASPWLDQVQVSARFGPASIDVVRGGTARTVRGVVGDQVTLLPVHGTARGVTTTGLRWLLVDADLAAGTTRGASNEMAAEEVTVAVGQGTVLVVRPGTPARPVPPRSTPYDPSPAAPATAGPGPAPARSEPSSTEPEEQP